MFSLTIRNSIKEITPFCFRTSKISTPTFLSHQNFLTQIALLSHFPNLTGKRDQSFHHQSTGVGGWGRIVTFSSGENSIPQLPRSHTPFFPFRWPPTLFPPERISFQKEAYQPCSRPNTMLVDEHAFIATKTRAPRLAVSRISRWQNPSPCPMSEATADTSL